MGTTDPVPVSKRLLVFGGVVAGVIFLVALYLWLGR